MKKVVCSLLLCACVAGVSADSKHDKAFWEKVFKGVETKIALHIVDDEGVPVPDVKVHFTFSRVERYDEKDCVADRDGNCVADNLTCGNSIEVNLSKDGYYDSSVKFCYISIGNVYEVTDGKWQPYPLERTVTLRKIMNPAALKIGGGRYDIPGTNQWYSFDAVRGDWVEPYGRGVLPDFDIFYEWTGWNPLECERQAFRVRFLNSKYNGYCFPDKTVESVFPYAYVADASTSYANDFYDECVGTNARDGVFDNKKDMLFRIRSETNKVGKVVSCYYGRFLKLNCYLRRDGTGGLLLRYQYNPVPNDTNLEDEEVSRRNERSRKSRQRRGDEPK